MVPWSLRRATADSCAREAHACTWACVAVHQVPVLTANAMLGGTYHTFVHTASQTVRKRNGLALRVHAPSSAMLSAVRAAGILALAVPPCLGFRPWPAMVDASDWLFCTLSSHLFPYPPPCPWRLATYTHSVCASLCFPAQTLMRLVEGAYSVPAYVASHIDFVRPSVAFPPIRALKVREHRARTPGYWGRTEYPRVGTRGARGTGGEWGTWGTRGTEGERGGQLHAEPPRSPVLRV